MTAALKLAYDLDADGNEPGLRATATGRSRPATRPNETVAAVLFWIFVGGLAWCPYSYAGTGLFAWGINAVLFPGLAALYEISILATGERHPVAVKEIGISAALFVAVVIWIVVQNSTWTPSSWHHPIWGMTADALGNPIEGSISVNRDLTSLALMRLITAASVFWLALQLCRKASRAKQFMMAISVISCGYAAYGLISFALASGPVSWFGQTSVHGFVSSTFINRNHYATYAGIGLVTMCGLILRLYRNQVTTVGGSLGYRIATIIEATGQSGAVLFGGAFLVFVVLLLTGSRAGIAATGLALMVLAVLWFGRRKINSHRIRKPKISAALFVILALFALGAAIVLAFGDTFFGKIAEGGVTDDNRIAVYLITLRSIFDAPLLGYGYGTFMDVFPMFRDRSISVEGVWQQAHNTYLEVFQGLGLVFGSMLVASIVLLVVKCCKGAIARRESIAAPAIAAGIACLVGVHALADFSLQVQAVALTFMAVLGAGVAQSESSRLVLSD
jgi:O-antigen ligase